MRAEVSQWFRSLCLGEDRLLAPLPRLKAHLFSHSLERAGQEWLSAESAMGTSCMRVECSARPEGAEASAGDPCQSRAASNRGGDCRQGLPETSADGGLGWRRRAGLCSSEEGQILGLRPARSQGATYPDCTRHYRGKISPSCIMRAGPCLYVSVCFCAHVQFIVFDREVLYFHR